MKGLAQVHAAALLQAPEPELALLSLPDVTWLQAHHRHSGIVLVLLPFSNTNSNIQTKMATVEWNCERGRDVSRNQDSHTVQEQLLDHQEQTSSPDIKQ